MKRFFNLIIRQCYSQDVCWLLFRYFVYYFDILCRIHTFGNSWFTLVLKILLAVLVLCWWKTVSRKTRVPISCSPCSPWWPFPYLVGVGLVLLLHSFRSRATSWVTPTPAMSSFICWCHVFLGRPRRLVPGIVSSITLRVTLVVSRLWTCPNQRRRPLRITSSIGERCNMRGISSFRIMISYRHSEDLAKHPNLRGSNLPLVGHLHRPAFAPIRQSRSDYGLVYLRFEPEGNLPVIQNSGQFSPAWPYHARFIFVD